MSGIFKQYRGMDYSGVSTADKRLEGLQVYPALFKRRYEMPDVNEHEQDAFCGGEVVSDHGEEGRLAAVPASAAHR